MPPEPPFGIPPEPVKDAVPVNVINLTVDVKALIETFCRSAMSHYEWAYPGNELCRERVHTALQGMSSDVKAIQTILKAIKPAK